MAALDDLDELRRTLDVARDTLPGQIDRAASVLREALARPGAKVLACGNGGSAASAQHFVAELVGRYRVDRAPIAAVALVADAVTLTAVANDLSFAHVFARQVAALARPGDALVALSTSGRSANVLSAAALARDIGCAVIVLTGRADDCPLAALADALISVPSDSVARIQEVHALALHALARVIEDEAVARPGPTP
jgi:D-sedoheptulose 7-phosphate isomerase